MFLHDVIKVRISSELTQVFLTLDPKTAGTRHTCASAAAHSLMHPVYYTNQNKNIGTSPF